MKYLPMLAVTALAVTAALPQSAPPPKTTLKVGDMAPDFTVAANSTSNRVAVKLSDFRGKKNVILAFFPAAFTGGWTKELTAYQAGIANFTAKDSQVLAMSTDAAPTLAHWAKELGAEFPLLSDHDRKITALYGVLIPDIGYANRTTFVIDMEGKIAYIEEGNEAIDITGADEACSRLAHKKQ
jgi:peroxiredoxin